MIAHTRQAQSLGYAFIHTLQFKVTGKHLHCQYCCTAAAAAQQPLQRPHQAVSRICRTAMPKKKYHHKLFQLDSLQINSYEMLAAVHCTGQVPWHPADCANLGCSAFNSKDGAHPSDTDVQASHGATGRVRLHCMAAGLRACHTRFCPGHDSSD
jgi:hypothetical protein